ncbi:hypothetical protein Prubr_42090 [Polymorphospora rubra]|uniref:Gram-positive cocci surface proteins LPxTG domain-containing protein n=1 Tax=Polymorphospora rubra TaxID=338584 RepID=A0A810N615_9ACTN|nr:hypothetical protein Prubr_42090 [Polymorphospora rubra]
MQAVGGGENSTTGGEDRERCRPDRKDYSLSVKHDKGEEYAVLRIRNESSKGEEYVLSSDRDKDKKIKGYVKAHDDDYQRVKWEPGTTWTLYIAGFRYSETLGHKPTHKPTHRPTHKPTHKPTHSPTHTPTHKPTHKPTATPTKKDELPVTGASTSTAAGVGLALVGAGAVALLVGRLRRRVE